MKYGVCFSKNTSIFKVPGSHPQTNFIPIFHFIHRKCRKSFSYAILYLRIRKQPLAHTCKAMLWYQSGRAGQQPNHECLMARGSAAIWMWKYSWIHHDYKWNKSNLPRLLSSSSSKLNSLQILLTSTSWPSNTVHMNCQAAFTKFHRAEGNT